MKLGVPNAIDSDRARDGAEDHRREEEPARLSISRLSQGSTTPIPTKLVARNSMDACITRCPPPWGPVP